MGRKKKALKAEEKKEGHLTAVEIKSEKKANRDNALN